MLFSKNRNLYIYLFTLFFLSFFIFNIKEISAANLNFSPITSTYNVGDIVKIKVILSTKEPANAVSGNISFPPDKLNITSLSKSSSIIDLWAQEPSFSNQTGLIKFEGVILGGYSGDTGHILTLVFKAKTEGVSYLNFSNVSILANDGLGTDISSKDSFTGTINLKNSIIPENKSENISTTKDCEEIPNNENVDHLSCLVLNTAEKIKEIEVSNTLPNNSLLIAIIVFCSILFIFIIVYLIALILKLKKYIRKKIIGIEKIVSRDFKKLEKNILSNSINSKDNSNSNLNKDEKILKNVIQTENSIIKEIDKIENNL